jgi:hypothetical protein
MVQEYYQKNPSLLANLRGSLYEEKIIKAIKAKAKVNKKEISKNEAEKLLKEENEKNISDHHDHHHDHSHQDGTQHKTKEPTSSKKASSLKKAKTSAKKKTKLKKVSKK